jgi:hypothetical protein
VVHRLDSHLLAGAVFTDEVTGTGNTKARILHTGAGLWVTGLADLASHASTWVAHTLAGFVVTDFVFTAFFATGVVFALTEFAELPDGAGYVFAATNTLTAKAVSITVAGHVVTGVNHTFVDHAEFIVYANLGEASAVIELAGSIGRSTGSAWWACHGVTHRDTVAVYAGGCIALSIRWAIHCVTGIHHTEVVLVADFAERAGELTGYTG